MRVLKVKITSAARIKWYSDNVGEEFYVSIEADKQWPPQATHKVEFDKDIVNKFISEHDYEVLYECNVELNPVESDIVKPTTIKKYKVLYKFGDSYGVTEQYFSSIIDFNNNSDIDYTAISLISESMKEF